MPNLFACELCIDAVLSGIAFKGKDDDPICAADGGKMAGYGEGCRIGVDDF